MEKLVIVTGATRGIGKAILEVFAKNNFFVAFTYHHSCNEAKKITKLYPNTKGYKIDNSSPQEIESFYNDIKQINMPLYAVINNAGIAHYSMLIDETVNDMYKTLNTDLLGTIISCKEAITLMLKEKEGTIINISSIWGLVGSSCESIYAAAKAGINAFTMSIAKEYENTNIKFYAFAPGVVKTDMLHGFTKAELRDIANINSSKKIATPSDIATLIYQLANNELNYTSGDIIDASKIT